MEETETQHQLHVLIPARLHQRVKVMAAQQRRSVTAETQLALEERVERFEAERERRGVGEAPSIGGLFS